MRAAAEDCTHFLLLNSDIEVRRADWLQQMVNVSNSSDRIGIVGTKHTFIRMAPTFGGVDGQCMLIKRQLVEEIGLLDNKTFPWNGSEIDFAARAFKKGYIYKVMPNNPELVIHYRAMSCRDLSSKPQVKLKSKPYDHRDTLLSAGIAPWHIPRFIWQIYKHLKGHFFYELSKDELLVARGKDESRRKFYSRFT